MGGGIGNISRPSINKSANVVQEQEQEMEGGIRNSMATDMEQVVDSTKAEVEENYVVLEAGGITNFIEYIKLDS